MLVTFFPATMHEVASLPTGVYAAAPVERKLLGSARRVTAKSALRPKSQTQLPTAAGDSISSNAVACASAAPPALLSTADRNATKRNKDGRASQAINVQSDQQLCAEFKKMQALLKGAVGLSDSVQCDGTQTPQRLTGRLEWRPCID